MSTQRTTRFRSTRAAWMLPVCVTVACGNTDGQTEGTAADAKPIFSNGIPNPPPVALAPGATDDGYRVAMAPAEGTPAAESTLDDTGDELVNKGLIQVTTQSNAEIFQWSTAGSIVADVIMRPISTHLCVLTRVGGNFDSKTVAGIHHASTDASDRCRSGDPGVGFDDAGLTWKLGGCHRGDNSVTVEAACVPGTNFVTDPGGIVTGSTLFSPRPTGSEGCPNDETAPMWPGIAVSFLSGVAGNFNGGGEIAKIISPASPLDAAVLSIISHTGKCWLDAGGYSVFANVLDGQHVTRRSYQISVSSKNGPKSKRLATTHQALCYLTSLSGDYNGAEERIRIAPEIDPQWGTEWWTLTTHAGGGSAYATAECIAYDQATIILQ